MSRKSVEKFAIEAAKKIEENPNIDPATKKELGDALKTDAASFSVPSTPVYMMAVWAVALIGIIVLIGSIWITLKKTSEDVPEFFAVALGAAIGALAGMLVPTSK